MKPNETLSCLYGELMDLIACLRIDVGAKQKKKTWTFDEVMALE